MSESEQIVNLIARQTKILISNHWPDISDFRDGDDKIKVAFSHQISYQGQGRTVETTISFGKRIKDSVVERVDTDQMPLNLVPVTNGEIPKKRRGRPKKNVIQSAIITAPNQG